MPQEPRPDRQRRKIRGIRMSDDDWEAIAKAAAGDGVSISDFIRYSCWLRLDSRKPRPSVQGP